MSFVTERIAAAVDEVCKDFKAAALMAESPEEQELANETQACLQILKRDLATMDDEDAWALVKDFDDPERQQILNRLFLEGLTPP